MIPVVVVFFKIANKFYEQCYIIVILTADSQTTDHIKTMFRTVRSCLAIIISRIVVMLLAKLGHFMDAVGRREKVKCHNESV